MACREYFCPSTHKLPGRFKQIVRATAENWHQYGLVVTERQLVAFLLGAVEERLGRHFGIDEVSGSTRLRDSIRRLLALKLDWPFRGDSDGGTLCHYLFEDGKYEREGIDYPPTGRTTAGLNRILRELGTVVPNSGSFGKAQALIEARLEGVLLLF